MANGFKETKCNDKWEAESDRKKREGWGQDGHNAFFFTAQGAKHAGKCLESMVSADPKALIHLRKTDKAHSDGSIKPWTIIHPLKEKVKVISMQLKITKNQD